AHIPYPSTPNFKNFTTDYQKLLVSDAAAKYTPTRASFVGTVKLHGTNATVVFSHGDKSNPRIQSRSWIIGSNKKDNMGTYALLSKAPLASLVDQILAARGQSTFNEIFIAGEIAGRGVQKGVAIVALERFFAIFNIRIDGHWVDIRQYKSCSLPEYRIFNVAEYKTYEIDIDFSGSTAAAHERMNEYTTEVYDACPFGSAFVDEKGKQVSGRGEGIVWTMVGGDGKQFDDTVLWNFKTKGESFSTTSAPKEKKAVVGDPATASAVMQFVDYALAERRFEQGVEYLEGEQARQGKPVAGYDIRSLGVFMKWVVEDTIKEERNEMERLGAPEKDAR
ncbi:hypothetical protein FB45DRAFT_726937, partial [Roridomyces roridus]